MIQFMDAERVRTQLDRVLASAAFADAGRASNFLRFVVLRALARAGEIKESVIAVEALGRSPSFDSKSDAIVRVEARRLRDRLDCFYRREGAEDPIVISLPKGGYVPEFSERQSMALAPAARKRSLLANTGWALFGVAALALAWSFFHKAPPPAGSFRLSILPPDGVEFESFAISPDGRLSPSPLHGRAISSCGFALWTHSKPSLCREPSTLPNRSGRPMAAALASSHLPS